MFISTPTPYPQPQRKERTDYGYCTPHIEERLARLEGVYDHLASKADLAELRSILKDDMLQAEIARLQADMAELKGSVKILVVAMTCTTLPVLALVSPCSCTTLPIELLHNPCVYTSSGPWSPCCF